jgi:hypothetical protein
MVSEAKRRLDKEKQLMTDSNVIVVHLRQPFRSSPTEMRSDPFWEFGSFGITTCHSKNLMKPGKSKRLKDVRLAFAQGGKGEMKLVFLTPPITKVVEYEDRSEVLWQPSDPFKFVKAPVLIDNRGKSDFPQLAKLIRTARRNSWLGRLSSTFRSRTSYLEPSIAREIVAVFDAAYDAAGREDLAVSYVDALPYMPPVIDRQREKTYEKALNDALRRRARQHKILSKRTRQARRRKCLAAQTRSSCGSTRTDR